jgi:hypothetical protein
MRRGAGNTRGGCAGIATADSDIDRGHTSAPAPLAVSPGSGADGSRIGAGVLDAAAQRPTLTPRGWGGALRLASVAPGGRNAALNHAAWTLGHWVAAGALEQGEVEDALYAAALANGLVADDGERQGWATIRSGLGAGLQEPIDLGRNG